MVMLISNSNRRLGSLFAVAILLLCGESVRAEFVVAQFKNAIPALNLDISLDPYPSGGSILNWNNVPTGQYNWQRTGGDTNQIKSNFWTFCIELTQNISANVNYNYDIAMLADAPLPGVGTGSTTGMGDGKADLIRELWGRQAGNLGADARNASAFQLAIWEIVFDYTDTSPGTRNVTTGAFYLRNINTADEIYVRNTANAWLQSLDGTGPFEYNLIALTSPDRQDQLTLATPSPGSFALAGVSVVCLLGWGLGRRPRLAQV